MRNRKHWFLPAMGICLLALATGCTRHATHGLGLDIMTGSKDTARVPSARLERTVLPSMKILSLTFEAQSADHIGQYLNAAYIELCTFINKHRLPSNRTMAFYYTYFAPFVVEAAVEVDSIPPVMDSLLNARVLEGGEVLIVHYKGPYEKAAFAYHALDNWLKDNHKKARGMPFEVYLNDPITIKDKNKLLTDIYQFIQ
jgi:effector-binding domain-containing protein